MTLRILLWPDCERKCVGCCNKDWDLERLLAPTISELREAHEIILTGGEPMLYPARVLEIANNIRAHNDDAPIYMYTADVRDVPAVLGVLYWIEGMTLTLHDYEDLLPFYRLDRILHHYPSTYSFRLNVFGKLDNLVLPSAAWQVRFGMEWIKNCPLPSNEIFRRWV